MTRQGGVLSAEHRQRISRIIATRTGLVFSKARETELERCLLESFSESSAYPSAEEYIRRLETDMISRRELKSLVARLTVGETYFFRNRQQFDLLRSLVLPRLIEQGLRTKRLLRFWSAGCATGEEPYSLAMMLYEMVPQISRWNILILATDISEDSLKVAEQGEYREWSFRDVAPQVKERYFSRSGDGYKINPDIRSMVTFRYLNLIEDLYPLAANSTNFMDLIICRNVMIYFKPALNTAITRRFYRSLNNGGYLLVGHTESADYVYQGFQKELHPGTCIFQKREQWSDADRGLRIRFRGTGHLPANTVPTWRRKAAPPREVAAADDSNRVPITRETILFEEAVTSHRAGKNRLAMEKFRDVLAMNPRNHRALYMLAMMEADQNHLRKAEEYCLAAIEAHPLSLEAHYLLAVIAREEGVRDKELEYLKKVLYINRDFVLGHFQLGVYYLREGTYPLARKFLHNALKLLEKWGEMDYIEGIEGMNVSRLRQIIQRDLEEIEHQGPLLHGG